MNLEKTIQAAEELLNISITVIDNHGSFHTSTGMALFNLKRQSHAKNSICKIGFNQKCIQHCRYEMNSVFEKQIEHALVETCWKGITEIIIPFNLNGKHLGMLYAGSWRKKTGTIQ